MKQQLLSGITKTLLAAAVCLPGLAQAQTTTPVFKQWPLTTNGQDSAAVRTANVTASSPTFKKLVVGDGSVIRAYSNLYGQSFAPAATGANWGTSAGGPGGTVKRGIYEQFTVTAATGATVRADSVILNAGFYATASSITVAVAYSRSNFTADSADVTGGKGPGGVFASPTTGGVGGPVALTQIAANTPNNATYRFALAGTTGVTLTAGQTLTVRVYVSCSSTSAGRYALLKNVIIKSQQAVLSKVVPRAQTTLQAYPNPAQNELAVSHPAAQRGAVVSVYGATGQAVATAAVVPGTRSTPVSLNQLATGIYLVEYRDGQTRTTTRIVKQ